MAGRQAVGWHSPRRCGDGRHRPGWRRHCQKGSDGATRSIDDSPKPRRKRRRKASWPDRRPVDNRGGVAGRHGRHQRLARADREVEKGGRLTGGSVPIGWWLRKSHSGPTMALRAWKKVAARRGRKATEEKHGGAFSEEEGQEDAREPTGTGSRHAG